MVSLPACITSSLYVGDGVVPEGCSSKAIGATTGSADIGSVSGRRRCRLDRDHVVVQSEVGECAVAKWSVAICGKGGDFLL